MESSDDEQSLVERHAGWNELFFDLVVVAGVGQLAHLLYSSITLGDVGLYAVLYLAFWTAWAGFMVYSDIAAAKTRTRNLLLAMLGMAVMAAAVPGIHDQHANAFVIAYVALRLFAGSVWGRGQIVAEWPLIQRSVGTLPWLASLFAPDPWRYWLWAAGAAIDLVVLLISSSERTMRHANDRLERVISQRPLPPDRVPPTLKEEVTDTAHLGERLRLYVIIVLGEGIIQIIDAASEHEHWDFPVIATALGAFALIAAIWTLSLLYGFDGVPNLNEQTLPARYAMLMHALLTGAVAAMAVALGLAVTHPDVPLDTGHRALLCGAMALYFVVGLVAALPGGVSRTWLLGWALPCTLLPIALAFLGGGLPTPVLVWLLAATVGWQILHNPGPPKTT